MAYDVLLRNGTLVDGTGAPARRADVGIAGGKIVEVGELKGAAKRTIDADGLVVAPGCIDPHTHYDAQRRRRDCPQVLTSATIMRSRAAEAIVLVFLAWLLAGCASDPRWTHPTKDSYEWKADAADCERFFSASDRDREACMKGKGWRPVK